MKTSLLEAGVLAGVLLLCLASPADRDRDRDDPFTRTEPRVEPVGFVEIPPDRGGEARYVTTGRRRAVAFRDGGVSITLRDRRRPAGDARAHGVRLDFEGAPGARPIGERPAPARVSAFRGPTAPSLCGARTFGRVAYRSLHPGVDVVFDRAADALKYTVRVAPGADPGRLVLRILGADRVTLTQDGALAIHTWVETLVDPAPVAWQEPGDGSRVSVAAAWELLPNEAGAARVRFCVGAHDPALPLVIDPTLPISLGFLGGAGEHFDGGASSLDEAVQDVEVGPDGCVYAAGWTTSTPDSFPVRVGPFVEPAGKRDAFVARLDPTGTRILWLGYIGGAERDEARALSVESRGGAVYVGGFTQSDEATFPVIGGPGETYGGQGDGWVARVRFDGSELEYCGYVGGSGTDLVTGVDADGFSGRLFVCGSTGAGGLPVTVGPDLVYNGSRDAFAGKVSLSGSSWIWLGYVGGIFDDGATSIVADGEGRAHVSGSTFSSEQTFPVRVGPDLTYNHPVPGFTQDGFVARVAADGRELEYCGYVGGLGFDAANAIALDASGRAYLTGTTLSDETTFPVRGGPFLVYRGATGILGDAFVAQVLTDGTDFGYAGYLGGAAGDTGLGIDASEAGDAFVTGLTLSADFPVTPDGTGETHRGDADAFLARVAPDGAFLSGGFVGGEREDAGNAIDFDGVASVLLGGSTRSSEATLPVLAGPDVTHNGGHPSQSEPGDGLLARYLVAGAPDVTVRLEPERSAVRPGETLRFRITVTNATDAPQAVSGWLEALRPDRAAFRGNPVAGPRGRTLPPRAEITREAELRIPPDAPQGDPFTLRAIVARDGVFPLHLAAFDFRVDP